MKNQLHQMRWHSMLLKGAVKSREEAVGSRKNPPKTEEISNTMSTVLL